MSTWSPAEGYTCALCTAAKHPRHGSGRPVGPNSTRTRRPAATTQRDGTMPKSSQRWTRTTPNDDGQLSMNESKQRDYGQHLLISDRMFCMSPNHSTAGCPVRHAVLGPVNLARMCADALHIETYCPAVPGAEFPCRYPGSPERIQTQYQRRHRRQAGPVDRTSQHSSGSTSWPKCQEVQPIVLDWPTIMAETMCALDASFATR
ncbi:hypothetical protein PBRA_004423 [Plasmodiophora brassicae]|nr:hypothetical protein PBRA_004423 [Plasmodiophora brassicae]